jgi:coenzyme F420-reducing hydrogenase beta subunit
MLINASAVTNEESIISRHLEIARDGFLALEKITEFCCSGCGLCISICPLESLKFNEATKRPVLDGKCNNCGFCYLACPRSFLPLSKIEASYFGKPNGEEEQRLGKFQDLFAARSRNKDIYQEGTPGGTTTALVHFLMEKGIVDAALLTKGKHPDVRYCMHSEPYIAYSAEDVCLSSHSKFEISPVLSKLRELSQQRSALFVGTPCHIMAFRRLQIIQTDSFLRDKMSALAQIAEHLTANIRFALSINCFLNHTNMDKAYEWLNVQEKSIIRFNENVSKDLCVKALDDGKDWRWYIKNTVVTQDGQEKDYDILKLGALVLYSGCLVCNNSIGSKHADATIGFYGAEPGLKEFGWNSVVLLNAELAKIVDEMVLAKKLEKRPLVRGYGRWMRKTLEWIIRKCVPALDVMGVNHYLRTGQWLYPAALKKMRGPRRGAYIFGLELFFLAQTLRKKIFNDGPKKTLKKAGAYMTTIY